MKLNEIETRPGSPDPDVLVQGVGVYKLSQVVANVRGKLEDLMQRANGPATAENWQTIDTLMKKQTLQAFVAAAAEGMKHVHKDD